jgi:hypothetical protein
MNCELAALENREREKYSGVSSRSSPGVARIAEKVLANKVYD